MGSSIQEARRMMPAPKVIAAAGAGLVLAACSTAQVQLAATDTCATNAAVVSALADAAKAGLLTSTQITTVGKDIAAIDPVCAASTPDAALTGAAATAAQDLARILTTTKGTTK